MRTYLMALGFDIWSAIDNGEPTLYMKNFVKGEEFLKFKEANYRRVFVFLG
jgi:hypothetical protein